MRRLFVTLMAVFALVSYGSQAMAVNNGYMAKTAIAKEFVVADEYKNVGEVLDKVIAELELILGKAYKAQRTQNAEELVCAFERFVDEMCYVYKKSGRMLQNMTPEEKNMYAPKIKEIEMLTQEFQELMPDIDRLNTTDEQKERVYNALQKLNAVETETEPVEDAGGDLIDVVISLTQNFKKELNGAIESNNAELVVVAFENYVNKMLELKEQLMNIDPDTISEAKMERFVNLAAEIQELANNADRYMEFTPQQETRLGRARAKMN